MKQERPDIDWCKLRLILARLKRDFGVSATGRLNWTLDIAQNFLTEMKAKAKLNVGPDNLDLLNSVRDVGQLQVIASSRTAAEYQQERPLTPLQNKLKIKSIFDY